MESMETEAPSAAAPDTTPYAAELFAKQPFRGYELTAVLAADDRRAVFKAHDRTMERTVAVKVMRPCPGREGVVEEFFSLAGSIARLRCPGAARGLDAGRSDGNFFLVYEFLPGESLKHKVERRQAGRLTEKESLKLARELAEVLQSLFDLGNPHGNLKPSNVVVAEGGKPRLADVGFAWSLAWPDDDAAFRAFPDFLPPERLAGEINIDVRGDLYSLGATWFWALMGRPVFRGATPEETIRMHMEEKAPALGTIDPKVSAATSQLVRWLLEKDRDARPRTPREFLRKLSDHPLLAAAEPSPGANAADAEDESDVDGEADPAVDSPPDLHS